MGVQQKQPQQQLPNKDEFVWREFEGVNTQPHRTSLKENDFAWLENVMPIGHGNLKVVPAQSSNQQSVSSGTAYYATTFNSGGTDYHFVVCTDGSAYQILATSPYTRTSIGGAGTFSGSNVWAVQWKNLGIVIVDQTKGYFDWNITAGNTLTTIDASKKGNLVAVFAGRVWIANGRTILFTDAGSYNSFAGSGGSFIMTDVTLHDVVTALYAANNYLYIFGTSSCNVISDVRVVGGVAIFSNTNLEASAGTSFPLSVFPYYRAVMFATPYGDYALFGATPQKISDDLDGIIPLIDFTKPVSGTAVIIYNQLCAVFCFTYNDPLNLGTGRQLLALYFNKKWFFSSQGAPKFIWGDYIAGVPTVFGTDGTNIFQLWQNTTASITSKIQSRFMDFGSSIYDKQWTKFGVEVSLPNANAVSVSATLESEKGSTVQVLSNTTAIILFGSGQITLVGAGTITIIGGGFIRMAIDPQAVGKYLGWTINSNSPQMQLTAALHEYKKMGANW